MRFKVRNAFIGCALYLWAIVSVIAIEVNPWLPALFVAYAVACMLIFRGMVRGAESRNTDHSIEFSRSGAAQSLGVEYGSFHHVYHSRQPVNQTLKAMLSASLKEKLGCTELREISLRDVDRDLPGPETRTFAISFAPKTVRQSSPLLLYTFSSSAHVKSVRWWVIVGGLRDPNKVFWSYALAPLTVPFAVWPYLRREFDPLSGLMTVPPGFFNSVDVLNITREIQFVAFETLVEVLDSYGIDTSDLKNQKASILNVKVSGGKASFGAVIQGAMNKVSGTTGAHKHG
jgi:hypothetical protein